MATILYTVRPGDTLWSIADEFHTTVNDIARYNGIADVNAIYPNQRLRIPVKLPRPEPRPRQYVVRPGDTLWILSRRFHTTVADLAERNDLQSPYLIYPGQVLTIS